jgi:hypothetical protein
MPTRRTVREVPPLDPACEWMLLFVTAEDVTALAAKVRAHRRPIPLQVPAEQVAERLNRTVTRSIGTYEWRQTWKPAKYRDWAEKVETAAQRLLSLLGDDENNTDDAVEHLMSEPVWLDGFARAAAGGDPEEALDNVRHKISAVRDLRTLASARKEWSARQPAVRRQAAEEALVREIAAVFEWAFGRPTGVSTYPDGGDGRRGGPTLVFIRGVLHLAGERIPTMEPGREELAAALLKLARRPYGVDDRVRQLREANDDGSETKCG